MGHTNSTANLSLPQFIGTDKPTWLGDINGAFSAIDSYAGTNDAAVAAAVSDASSAISQASAAVNTANTANTTAGNASTAANNAIGVANTANAIAGTVDAKVGLLADLNTTDRTSIVNAINEVLSDATGHGIYEAWLNPAPGSAFAAQSFSISGTFDTLFIELSDYTLVSIEVSGGSCRANRLDVSGSDGLITKYWRDFTATQNGTNVDITATDGKVFVLNTYGTAPTIATNNNYLIPVRIFGVVHNS